MTGNVAQVFLEDEPWEATLRSLHAALRPGGRLAFDSRNPSSRNPSAREWVRWTREATYQRLEDTPHGPVETWLEVVLVERDRVRLQGHNVFLPPAR